MGEVFVTFWAGIGSFTHVNTLVLGELGALTETTTTLRTLEGPLSTVGALVPYAVRDVGEVLATLTATVGLLPSVRSLVLEQRRAAPKAVTTPGTAVGLLARV